MRVCVCVCALMCACACVRLSVRACVCAWVPPCVYAPCVRGMFGHMCMHACMLSSVMNQLNIFNSNFF